MSRRAGIIGAALRVALSAQASSTSPWAVPARTTTGALAQHDAGRRRGQQLGGTLTFASDNAHSIRANNSWSRIGRNAAIARVRPPLPPDHGGANLPTPAFNGPYDHVQRFHAAFT
jgi:hypothetical protein